MTKCPLLWKKVDVEFQWCNRSINKVSADFAKNLPTCATHIKLDFWNLNRWGERLKFETFCCNLGSRCSSLKALILHNTLFSVSLRSAIDLCRQSMPNLEIISFRDCSFTDYSVKVGCDHPSKLKVLDVYYTHGSVSSTKLTLLNMTSLKKLCLFGTSVNDDWFSGDTSSLRHLQVLNLQAARDISSRTFQILQVHAPNLIELYLCRTNLGDSDFTFDRPVFPQLRILCLIKCLHVTCVGVVSLVQSCQFLQDVYVDDRVVYSYAEHPFVIDNWRKLEIVKTNTCMHYFHADYLQEE